MRDSGAKMADNKEYHSSSLENSAEVVPDALSQNRSSFPGRPHSLAGVRPGSRREPGERSMDADSLDGDNTPGKENLLAIQREREERVRHLREKQNEERLRKLEELKQQALATQKFREQKEEERRRRLEELRHREDSHRHQVEERKRQIDEAERDRREAIMRKNQEREARLETRRRNERSSIVFAFGSSTPRMLEPADTGGSYWATRRATSTTTLFSGAPLTLTRRGSERDLDGSKKRATSAGGLDRKPATQKEDGTTTPDGLSTGTVTPRSGVARRKTDLVPTIPSPRDRDGVTPPGSRGRRSTGNTPNRAYSMSRLDQLSQPRRPSSKGHSGSQERGGPGAVECGGSVGRALSSAKSMSHLAPGRGDAGRSMTHLAAAPIPPPRPTRAERLRQRARNQAAAAEAARNQTTDTAATPGFRSGETTPSRPQSAMSQQSVSSMTSSVGPGPTVRNRPVAAPRRPRPASIAVTGVTVDAPPRFSLSSMHKKSAATPDTTPTAAAAQVAPERNSAVKANKNGARKPESEAATPPKKPPKTGKGATPKGTPLQSPQVDTVPEAPSAEELAQPATQPQAEPSQPMRPEVPEPTAAPVADTPHPAEPQPSVQDLPGEASQTSEMIPPQLIDLAPPPTPAPSEILAQADVHRTFQAMEQKHQEDIWAAERAQMEAQPILPVKESEKAAPLVDVSEPAESGVVPPKVAQPSVAQPSLAQPSVAQPSVAQPSVAQPSVAQPSVAQPSVAQPSVAQPSVAQPSVAQPSVAQPAELSDEPADMTASMIRRITTEEEAKAALAERRRQAREQAEREAELERQRLEAERLAEEERLRQEEEEQRKMEEEMIRLAAEARQAEEQRLLQAIQEAQKREEEERKRREEEARLKLEKEEAERKAKEEADRQRRETDLRLKKEEEERQARRRRVEAIMSRTRTKGGAQSSTPTKENGDTEPDPSEGTPTSPATSSQPSNGHSNGVDNVQQNNTTNVLLDLKEHDLLASLSNEDCINSNLSNGSPAFIAFQDSGLSKKQDSNVVTDLLS